MIRRFHGLIAGTASLLLLGPAASAAERIALLPIAVHSRDESSGYLSEGLADMISARLEQQSGVTVVRVAAPAGGTTNAKAAIEAGRAAGGDFVVFGAFTQFGAGASLDLQCAKIDSEDDEATRRIFVQSGTLGEIIPKLDDLAAKIRRFVVSGPGAAPAASPAATAAGGDDLGEIRRRLDALERAVYAQPVKPPPPAAPARPSPGETR